MQIHIKSESETIAPGVVSRTEEKLKKLERFLGAESDSANAFIDFSRESGSKTSDSLWRVSILLGVGGREVYAAESGPSPEAASEAATAELKRELVRHKGKNATMTRRAGAFLKRLMGRE